MKMKIRKSFLATLTVTVLFLAQVTDVAAISAFFVPQRVSIAADGTEGDNAAACPGGVCADTGSLYPSVSADGRFVAFSSASSNLVPNDTNSVRDIFVKDRLTGEIARASTAADGTQANDASQNGFFGNWEPSISADGRFVAFYGYSSNLVPNDTNGFPDVFVKDLQTGAITNASKVDNLQTNDRSFDPQISANGRFVVFETVANNLRGFDEQGNPIDSNGAFDIFRKDLETGELATVSLGSGLGGVANAASRTPSISADGRFVAYASSASNIAPNDTNGNSDIIVTDMDDLTHRIASIKSDGTQGDFAGGTGLAAARRSCDISADGRFVVFHTNAAFTPEDDNGGFADVYLRDMVANTTTLISKNPTTGLVGNHSSFDGTISADGRFVAFVSLTGNLLDEPHFPFNFSVYLLDRELNLMRETPYMFPNGSSGIHPEISDDGNFVVFATGSPALIANDTNNISDIFAVDLRINEFRAFFTSDGGDDSIAITAQDSWRATSNATFITITSGGSGTGDGTIEYRVMPNPGPEQRRGTISINGMTFVVYQDGISSE